MLLLVVVVVVVVLAVMTVVLVVVVVVTWWSRVVRSWTIVVVRCGGYSELELHAHLAYSRRCSNLSSSSTYGHVVVDVVS